MRSIDLANKIGAIVDEAQGRVTGIGDEQYSEGDVQKFESVPIDQLVQGLREELLDTINYAVMVIVRLDRARRDNP